jgi:hypothetical protein
MGCSENECGCINTPRGRYAIRGSMNTPPCKPSEGRVERLELVKCSIESTVFKKEVFGRIVSIKID